jgi:hypothetical protein
MGIASADAATLGSARRLLGVARRRLGMEVAWLSEFRDGAPEEMPEVAARLLHVARDPVQLEDGRMVAPALPAVGVAHHDPEMPASVEEVVREAELDKHGARTRRGIGNPPLQRVSRRLRPNP